MVLDKVTNAFTGASPATSNADEGASLTTVLDTPALRIELALLVLLTTDAMRSELLATFDPDKTHELSPPTSPSPAPTPVHDLISFDAPQDAASISKQRDRANRVQEIESTQMQALRRSALTFFDKWRAGVLNRICEVLCIRGEAVRQATAKRKQDMAQKTRLEQSNSLLLDFGGDPFSEDVPSGREPERRGFYETIENKLQTFDEKKRILILHCLLLLLLSLEHYTAHSRVLLVRLSSSLQIDIDVLTEREKAVAQGLLASVASRMDAEDATKRQAASDSASKRWKIGLAAVGGAVLIGVTGGLAAPLLAAGVGTVMGGLGLGAVSGLLGTLAGSSVLVGSLFGAYGGRMTGKVMRQYAQEVRDFEFIPTQDPDRPSAQVSQEWSDDVDARDPSKRAHHRLRVSVGVSGWLNSPTDVVAPWEVIDPDSTEPFTLRFELDAMLRLGNSLKKVLFSYAWDGITYTVVSRTLLGALYAGLWPLGLVKAASTLDNPFSIAIARADKAGKVMARALIDKVQGERPVTLLGYSTGARVIYSRLVELADQHAFGLVESVVLMGAPTPSDSKPWRKIRSVVTGRLINVYSSEDYILGFLYRSTKLQRGVAGLQEVKDVFGVENLDVSDMMTGHDKYRYLVGSILRKTQFGDIDLNKVSEQERALSVSEQQQKRVREQARKREQETRKGDQSSHAASDMIAVLDKDTSNQTQHSTAPIRASTFPSPQRQEPAITKQKSLPVESKEEDWANWPDMDPLSDSVQVVEQRPERTRPVQRPGKVSGGSLLENCQKTSKFSSNTATASLDANPTTKQDLPQGEQKSSFDDVARTSSSQVLLPAPAPPMSTDENPATGVIQSGLIQEVNVNDVPDGESSDDEVSKFGELSMVEPLPLEEGDLGLMH